MIEFLEKEIWYILKRNRNEAFLRWILEFLIETEKKYQEKLKESLINLEAKAPQIYKEVKHEIPWKLNLDLDYQRYN